MFVWPSRRRMLMAKLRSDAMTRRCNLSHLQEIHKRIFGDIYEWAGQDGT